MMIKASGIPGGCALAFFIRTEGVSIVALDAHIRRKEACRWGEVYPNKCLLGMGE